MRHYSRSKPETNQLKHKTLFRLVVSLIVLSTICVVVHADSSSQIVNPGQQSASQTGGEETDATLATVASGTGLLVVLSVLMVGLLVTRRVRSSSGSDLTTKDGRPRVAGNDSNANRNRTGSSSPNGNHDVSFSGAAIEQDRQSAPTRSSHSAYRIDQEVRKRVLGFAHGEAVLASRAPEDRRAIETSLLRCVTSSESDDERRRAREALEQHGFVPRYCATLLSATNAFDRTSAARTLGEIGVASALPFLLEALYDVDSRVRNQVVMSIGELKLPSSMGVLLDVARKHPQVSDNLLSRALNACSASGLAFLDGLQALAGSTAGTVFDITQLEPVSPVEDLPETSDEQSFDQVSLGLESKDPQDRVDAAKALAQFPVKKSVVLLTEVVRTDPDSDVKASAINSLTFIDHWSVFPAILLAMAEESRMVRAAAARALGRLSFDRSEEYVRLLQTADEQILRDVAEACIEAGIVEQYIDRLASCDRYQAYETFALISLLAKAQRSEVMLDALTSHPDLDVCLSLIHLLAMTSQPELLGELEHLAERTDIRDELKAALREGRNKSEQLKAKREALPVATDEVALDAVGDQSGQLDSRSTSVNPGQPEDSTEVENPLAPREGYMSDKQIDDRIDLVWKDERNALCARGGAISTELLNRLESKSTGERAAALNDLAQLGGDDAFHLISRAFDDQSPDVRNAAARALYDLDTDRVASFTRALHDGSLDRRRRIGASLAACGLASDAIANLTAESREKTYDAFSLLFLMAKTGEVQPLLRAMEHYPSSEIRLAVVTLLALSGQPDIVPALKRLSVRGSQPTDVRSALMEAINRINSQSRETV